jgi:hypothetical protein
MSRLCKQKRRNRSRVPRQTTNELSKKDRLRLGFLAIVCFPDTIRALDRSNFLSEPWSGNSGGKNHGCPDSCSRPPLFPSRRGPIFRVFGITDLEHFAARYHAPDHRTPENADLLAILTEDHCGIENCDFRFLGLQCRAVMENGGTSPFCEKHEQFSVSLGCFGAEQAMRRSS